MNQTNKIISYISGSYIIYINLKYENVYYHTNFKISKSLKEFIKAHKLHEMRLHVALRSCPKIL